MRFHQLFLLLFVTAYTNAQTNFNRQINIPVTENGVPLHNPWAGGMNFPLFSSIELNGDTLTDLFFVDVQNMRVITMINNGNSNRDLAWDYAPQYAEQFPPVKKFAFLYDYNCDGKADFFTLSSAFQCSAGITAYQNISVTPGVLQWQQVDSCMQETFMGMSQIIYTDGSSLPHFTDIDNDGDMDILGYNSFPNGRIALHKNYSMENSGNCNLFDFEYATGCYGNFSLNIGGTNTVGNFHSPCRIGRYDQLPTEYTYDQSEAARRDDTISSIYALDVDGDSHKDLLIGDVAYNNTLMVHSNGIEMDSQDTLFPSYDTPALFNGFHYHAYFDTDNDGKKDLVVSPNYNENKKGIWNYKNTNTNSSPVFAYQTNKFLQNQMIDGGEDACPVFFDYDSDNLQDIVMNTSIYDESISSVKSALYLYKNTGTVSSPAYELISTDYAGLGAAGFVSPIYPAFGDLDGDGDKDMLAGLENGRFHYFQNIAPLQTPAAFAPPIAAYMGMDVGKYATPQLYDLDRDGKLDIISGNQRGTISFYRNTGTATAPAFSATVTQDPLGCISLAPPGTVDGYSVPFFYDSAGQMRLVVASDIGNIFTYDSISGNINGCYKKTGTVFPKAESFRIKFNITVNGADINGDSLTDIIIGQSTGGAEIRYQSNSSIGINDVVNIKPTFEVFPNPAEQYINIHVYNAAGPVQLKIFDSIGKLISEKSMNQSAIQIQTGNFPAGIYFVQLNTGIQSLSRKIIVRH